MSSNNPLFFRHYTCPICETAFKSYSVRSSATFVEKRESDFHIIYRGHSPLHYSIVVCPVCEYAASNSVFNQALPKEQQLQLARALKILKKDNRPDFGGERDAYLAMQCFQLAVRTAQLKKVPPGELAGLLLGTAWVAREANQPEIEVEYRREALKYYLQAYHDSYNLGNLNELQVAYLIGELYRRDKEYQEAINWFNVVIGHKNIKSNPTIEKMAREQWALCREEAQQAQ
ncbi:MAG: DUF2225 domain-containing protein [Syntrophomonadaceae bacterium]|nr:DUF2225 domain-containing protein [Syntrophomonadaceae bacterium]